MAAVPPYQHVRSIGEDVSAGELLLPEGHRLRPVDIAAAAAAGATECRRAPAPAGGSDPHRRRDRAGGQCARARRDPRHQLADAGRPGPRGRMRGLGDGDRAGRRGPDRRRRPGGRGRGRTWSSWWPVRAPGATTTPPAWSAELGVLAVHGVAVRPGHPVVLGVVDATPVLGCPGYPVSAALTFEIFAAPLLAGLEGRLRRPGARRVSARLARKLPSVVGMDDWVRVRLGSVRGEVVASPLPRGAGVLTSLVRADGLLRVPAGVEGHHAGERVSVELLRGLTGDRAHHRRDRFPRPGPRPRRQCAARRGSDAEPGLDQRGVARRPGGAARRAVPRRRLTPAAPGHREVHAALPRGDDARP